MAFNMSNCKKGDSLLLRNGKVIKYKSHLEPLIFGLHLAGSLVYNDDGSLTVGRSSERDVVGFYEEGNSLDDNQQEGV